MLDASPPPDMLAAVKATADSQSQQQQQHQEPKMLAPATIFNSATSQQYYHQFAVQHPLQQHFQAQPVHHPQQQEPTPVLINGQYQYVPQAQPYQFVPKAQPCQFVPQAQPYQFVPQVQPVHHPQQQEPTLVLNNGQYQYVPQAQPHQQQHALAASLGNHQQQHNTNTVFNLPHRDAGLAVAAAKTGTHPAAFLLDDFAPDPLAFLGDLGSDFLEENPDVLPLLELAPAPLALAGTAEAAASVKRQLHDPHVQLPLALAAVTPVMAPLSSTGTAVGPDLERETRKPEKRACDIDWGGGGAPAPTTVSPTTPPPKKRKPTRPKTAYNFFCSHIHQTVVDENPEETSFGDITRIRAARWKAVKANTDQHKEWEDKAAADKLRYKEQMTAIAATNDTNDTNDDNNKKPSQVSWEDRREQLANYKTTVGDMNVSYVDVKNKQLFLWVQYQRTQYRLLKQGKSSSMTPERIQSLNELEFDWRYKEQGLRDAAWNDQLQELIKYRDTVGDTDVVQRYDKNERLGRWVNTQRIQFKLLTQGMPNNMTPERIQSLNEIGFLWEGNKKKIRDDYQQKWEERRQELIKYKDMVVPQQYDENEQLGRWVSTQRNQHKLLTQGMPTTMTPERIQSLNEIGFLWEVEKTKQASTIGKTKQASTISVPIERTKLETSSSNIIGDVEILANFTSAKGKNKGQDYDAFTSKPGNFFLCKLKKVCLKEFTWHWVVEILLKKLRNRLNC